METGWAHEGEDWGWDYRLTSIKRCPQGVPGVTAHTDGLSTVSSRRRNGKFKGQEAQSAGKKAEVMEPRAEWMSKKFKELSYSFLCSSTFMSDRAWTSINKSFAFGSEPYIRIFSIWYRANSAVAPTWTHCESWNAYSAVWKVSR